MYLLKSGVYRDEKYPNITLVERCETIISNENINWANLQTNNDKKENKNEIKNIIKFSTSYFNYY